MSPKYSTTPNSTTANLAKSSKTQSLSKSLPLPHPPIINIDIQNLLTDELQQLQTRGYIETADIPDLGPIPPSSPVSPHLNSPEASDDEDSSSSSANSDSEPSDEDDDAGAAEDDDE